MKPAIHKANHWLPDIVSALMGYKVHAITIWRTVYWRGEVLRQYKVHEEAHVEQWQTLGFWAFLKRYVSEYRAGRKAGLSKHEAYRAISFERTARRANPYESE